jgi:hypothetical protein
MTNQNNQSIEQSMVELSTDISNLAVQVQANQNYVEGLLQNNLPKLDYCINNIDGHGAQVQAVINKATFKQRVDFRNWFIHHPFTVGAGCALVTLGALFCVSSFKGEKFEFKETNIWAPAILASVGAVGASMAKSYEKQQQAGDAMLISEISEKFRQMKELIELERTAQAKQREADNLAQAKQREADNLAQAKQREADNLAQAKQREADQLRLDAKREADNLIFAKQLDTVTTRLIQQIDELNERIRTKN